MKKLENYKRYIFAGISVVAIGITLSSTLKNSFSIFGTIFIAIGGLIFIIGLKMKKDEIE